MHLQRLVPLLTACGVLACGVDRAYRRAEAVADEGELAPTAALNESDSPALRAPPAPASLRLASAEQQGGGAQKTPAEGSSVTGSAEVAPSRAPVTVYTAQLTMAVFDVAPGLKAIEVLARELGGFMGKRTNDAITVRVPVARFQEALDRLESIGDITARDIDAEDVTEAYLDLEVRLKSARAVRERLEHLLARASEVKESIAIERELERVVGEIERLEGRLRYLRERAQFSTISVTFAARPREVVARDAFRLPFPWLDQLGLARLLELR
jgi:hypothetical protein